MRSVLPSEALPRRVPSGRVTALQSRASQGRAGGGEGRGHACLTLTALLHFRSAREAHMEQSIHEGVLYQDKYKRYCLYEPGLPEHKLLTCTSGCRLEVWLNRAWIGFPC
jgi:hypothetical protein